MLFVGGVIGWVLLLLFIRFEINPLSLLEGAVLFIVGGLEPFRNELGNVLGGKAEEYG